MVQHVGVEGVTYTYRIGSRGFGNPGANVNKGVCTGRITGDISALNSCKQAKEQLEWIASSLAKLTLSPSSTPEMFHEIIVADSASIKSDCRDFSASWVSFSVRRLLKMSQVRWSLRFSESLRNDFHSSRKISMLKACPLAM